AFLGDVPRDSAPRAEVRLVEFDPESETKILAGIIFQQTHGNWDDAVCRAKQLDDSEKRDLLGRYLVNRSPRWQKVGRAFENAYMRFEIVMDIGSYRDLHRHRMMTQERQSFSTFHGYSVPPELQQAGLAAPFEEALAHGDALFRKMERIDRDLA